MASTINAGETVTTFPQRADHEVHIAIASQTTVVVVCREFSHLTQRCINACLSLCSDAEIIVVADRLPGINEYDVPKPVRLIKSVQFGLGYKRNVAVRAATRKYIALIDDDAFPREGWLEAAIGALESDELSIGIVGGPTPSPPNLPLKQRVVDNALHSFLVTGHHSFRKTGSIARDCDFVSSCNLVIRREDYLRIGGMDEKCFTGDDIVLCAWRDRAGLTIRFVPNALVYHTPRTLRGFTTQRICRGYDALAAWRLSRLSEILFYLMSAGFVAALAIALPASLWLDWLAIYLAVLGTYVAICLVEAVRTSHALREVPGTLLAIWIGNLGPGVGLLMSLLGVRINLHRWYRLSSTPAADQPISVK